jgi:cytochrome c-type biogenesis protein CcmH/NrfG
MMLDRDKITFWTRLGAIVLAAIFVGSFVFMGIGTNISYNLFELLGGGQNQPAGQTTGPEDQIERARADLEENPDNPRTMRRLAGLYIQAGRTDEAIEVLERGREVAPDDPYIPLLLGQAHDRKAQAQTDEGERQATYARAGDSYVAAAEVQEGKDRKAQAYLLAGQAYEQAGDNGRAIQYWNDYLDLEPEGEQADAVRERIQTLLEGGETTGGAAAPPESPTQE